MSEDVEGRSEDGGGGSDDVGGRVAGRAGGVRGGCFSISVLWDEPPAVTDWCDNRSTTFLPQTISSHR